MCSELGFGGYPELARIVRRTEGYKTWHRTPWNMCADGGPAVCAATAAQGIEPRRQVPIDAQAEQAEHPLHMPRLGVYILLCAKV